MSDPMDDLEISEVDPHDDDAFAAWHAAYAAGESDLGDVATVWTRPELQALMQDDGGRRWQGGYRGVVGGQVVCTGYVATPMLDNLSAATVQVDVVPPMRRRGLGSAMLAHCEAVARERGRTLLDGEASWPYGLGTDGTGWHGVRFAQAHGYSLALSDVQRELRLPVDTGLLDRLAADAAARHGDYTLRSWVGRIPDELAEGWVALSASLMTEAPTGEKELEPEKADVAALRQGEQVIAAQGRTRYCTVALDAAGDVVAYTDLATTVHEPDRAYQWGTLVRRDARGRRLGLAVKVANLRQLQQGEAVPRRVFTWNAEVNGHMIGVNEQLGFRAVARCGEFQKRL